MKHADVLLDTSITYLVEISLKLNLGRLRCKLLYTLPIRGVVHETFRKFSQKNMRKDLAMG